MKNLSELNSKKKKNVTGGGLVQYTPAGVAVWLSYEIISNWSDVKSGIKDGYNDAMSFLENFEK